jgi:hypothetical protein
MEMAARGRTATTGHRLQEDLAADVRHLHVQWRERLEPVDTPADWPNTDEHDKPYELHRVVR